jgi:hypothetical protein
MTIREALRPGCDHRRMAVERQLREFTESGQGSRCRWCGRGLPPRAGPGRRREFCKPSCRQLDYQARRRATEVGLSEHELIVARRELDDLYDRLYVLEAAIEDVDRDLADDPTAADYRDAVAWLLAAARPVVEQRPFAEKSIT